MVSITGVFSTTDLPFLSRCISRFSHSPQNPLSPGLPWRVDENQSGKKKKRPSEAAELRFVRRILISRIEFRVPSAEAHLHLPAHPKIQAPTEPARPELELELIQSHMTQKPMLRGEGGRRTCAHKQDPKKPLENKH